MEDRKWRLPAGVDELLPPDARALELLRRQVLDVFHLWGFEYIDPPVVEYLDALLVGAGDDMNLQTLKTVDQKTGRMLGVRADMTAQAVRVDAHSLPLEGVQRLCYAGNVVFANPVSPLDVRNPLKVGAELFGEASPKADAEVIALMLEVLRVAGIGDPIVVLGHMGIYQNLVANLELPPAREVELFTAVQSKAEADIARLLEGSTLKQLMVRLPMLMGEREVLTEARTCLVDAGDAVVRAIDQLESLADLVVAQSPDVALRFDLAELVGYGYHNGPVFSAYQAEVGRALARGGRYDGIGEAFGRARPATGFDVILNELVESGVSDRAIWVPWTDNQDARAEQHAQVRSLRAQGEVVVSAFNAEDDCPTRCDRVLINQGTGWIVDPVSR